MAILSFIKFVPIEINRKIREGKLKEILRRYYFKFSNPLYGVNSIISECCLEEKVLKVMLKNGLVFYGMADKSIYPAMKYGSPGKMGKIANYKHYYTFLLMINEQFISKQYEKYVSIKPGNIIIDIGANIGTFTVKAAKATGETGRVIAIEPDADNLQILTKNIHANKLTNVTIVPKGVWSSKSLMKLFKAESGFNHSIVEERDSFTEVEVDTIDNILENLGVTKADILKLDIEGAETEAIRGMDKTLGIANVITGEYHFINGRSTYRNISQTLESKDFICQKEGDIFFAHRQIDSNK